MAELPISIRDIITPYDLFGEEVAEVYQSSNNRVYVARGGGYRYSLNLNIKPMSILSTTESVKFETVRAFLTKNPQMEIPIFNVVPNTVTGTATCQADAIHGQPGAYTVKINAGSYGGGPFQTGQYVTFGVKAKIYQIESYSAEILTLVQRLRHTVTAGDVIGYAGNFGGVDFNGIVGGFVNQDFGNRTARIEGGILGQIGPLSLIENI